MATTTTRQLREPFVEAAGLGITNKGLGLLGKSIPTSTYTGRGFVADQSALEKQAAEAVIAFEPKIVYPYHYRGKEGFSDISLFKELVDDSGKNIEVRLVDWYPRKPGE